MLRWFRAQMRLLGGLFPKVPVDPVQPLAACQPAILIAGLEGADHLSVRIGDRQ